MTSRESWDAFYMGLARTWSARSRDPSTKVGAVIVRPNKTQASAGFNDFPRGVAHAPERYEDRGFKYPAIVHAELNAVLNAREPLDGHTIYCTFHPCARCAAAVIQAGIRCVVVPNDPIPDRWREDMGIAASLLVEAGVEVREIAS